MPININLRKVASDACDMAITPDTVTVLAKHDAQYHPGGYEDWMSCKFRQAMERGDSADRIDAAEKEEAKAKAEIARLMKRYEDVGRIILTFTDDESQYEKILGEYGFSKSDDDYQEAHDIISQAAEDYDGFGDELGDSVGELKASVLRVDGKLTSMKRKNAAPTPAPKPNVAVEKPSNPSASANDDRDDLRVIRGYLEKCARLLNGRAGNVAAIQSSGRWPLLKEVSGGKLGKEIGDRLDEMAKGGDAAVVKAAMMLMPVYGKIVQSSKSGWTVKPGIIVGEEDLFDD